MLNKIKKIKLSFENWKCILGSLLIITGIISGLYVGIYVMFVGGIIQVINAIRATSLIPMDFAVGLAKIIFCSLVGYITVFIPVTIGVIIIES